MRITVIRTVVILFISFASSAAEIADTRGGQIELDKDERLPICKCICHKAAEGGGGHEGLSGKIWFRATADTKCDVNNGAECDYSGKPHSFVGGKTKDCNKAFVTRYPN